jgi:hypothetical protein
MDDPGSSNAKATRLDPERQHERTVQIRDPL